MCNCTSMHMPPTESRAIYEKPSRIPHLYRMPRLSTKFHDLHFTGAQWGVNGGHITFVGQGTIHIPTHHDHTASYLPIAAYEWPKPPPPGAQHHNRHLYGVSSPPYKYTHACCE